ncbi:MAG TPA: SusD/RagB family nutrient-binding outer membrane lipoprotein, partial [Chitinophaga sp.]
MKIFNKIFNRTALVVGVATLGLGACTKNFERYNIDNSGLSDSQLAPDFNNLTLLRYAQQSIYNFAAGGDPNSFQLQQNLNADCFSGYFMSATPFNAGQNNLNYSMVTSWNGEPFKAAFLNVMKNIATVRRLGIDTSQPAVWGVALITQVAAMSRVTDIYGPIPYSKAGTATTNIPYDAQQDVYKRFFLELDTATSNLRAFLAGSNQTLPFSYTKFDASSYQGNMAQWLHFANSLRLRLAMHIIKADSLTAKAEAEKAMDPASGGLITTNADNFSLPMTASSLTNPLVFISQQWQDIRINAAITSYMNGYKDPRISRYFDKSTDEAFPAAYVGIRIGSITGANKKEDYVNYSALSTSTFNLKTPVTLMTAAEVYFLRAEAALYGWANTDGSAQSLYEAGVNTSMSQWNVAAGAYLSDTKSKPASYHDPKNSRNDHDSMTSITIAWSEAATQAEKKERIITQKWIAMFPEGQEAWTEYRRTGYP